MPDELGRMRPPAGNGKLSLPQCCDLHGLAEVRLEFKKKKNQGNCKPHARRSDGITAEAKC